MSLLRRRRVAATDDDDTRGDHRVPVRIPVTIEKGADCRKAEIVDLTMYGAKIYFADIGPREPLCLNQLLSVRPNGGRSITARLRWMNDRHCGVQFIVPMQAEMVMRFEADSRLWLRSRPSRAQVDLRAEVIVANKRHVFRALDISIGGARLRHYGKLQAGTPLMMSLDGMMPLAGYVRWSDQSEAGMIFNRLLSVESARHIANISDISPIWTREVTERHTAADILS
ncbi:PilZ domain-containing protein [Sphingomonas floccifaciens]|uniref:PilZ domain-containing protein n=1 Tax=Sphingomonas floccifaciens TaxID=1844115 RepID=A0ABW4NCH3_9SPHN